MKYISIMLIAVIICLGMAFGCSQEQKAGNFREELFYFKDHRTGLCFAAAFNGMATVPCEKVEKYLK